MRYFKILFFAFLIFSSQLQGQVFKRSTFGVGVGNFVTPGYVSGIGGMPYAFFTSGRHEYRLGPEIYNTFSLYGVEAEYRNHCLNFARWLSGYFILDFQWVRYSTGAISPVRFHYHGNLASSFSLIRFKTFDNIVGGALQWNFKKIFSIYAEGGADYEYVISSYSPYNTNHENPYPFEMGKRWDWTWVLKCGISVRLWKEPQAPFSEAGDTF